MERTSFCVKIIYKFFLKTHQQNLVFSLYSRGSFFLSTFSFWFSLYKNILSHNLKGGFRMHNLYTVNKI